MVAGHGRAMQGHLDGYGVGMHLDDGGFGTPVTSSQPGHQFGGLSDPGVGDRQTNAYFGPAAPAPAVGARKRKRNDNNVDPAITANPTGRYRGSSGASGVGGAADRNEGAGNTLDIREMPPQRAISDARAAGVHSAVALFRQPSATSKKYTRPPMSKMFTSLELSPENFLHLQAAAKAYMLDDNYPDRRECVGQRGRGDSEMVKLRLWNCVRDFLEREGNGMRFFGEHVVNEGMGPRNMIWPRDDQKIISLVMPLLRRMVTNERQRQYAIETRKGGNVEEKSKQDAKKLSDNVPASLQQYHQPPPSNTQLGMTDMLKGYPEYPTDWDSLSQMYDRYNQDLRLDNLGSISGLPQEDWWGLVATIDGHYQIDHNGNGALCDDACFECTVTHIMGMDCMAQATLRITGEGENLAARNYFATGITQDATRIIRNYLTEHPMIPQDPDLSVPGPTQAREPNDSGTYQPQPPVAPSSQHAFPPSSDTQAIQQLPQQAHGQKQPEQQLSPARRLSSDHTDVRLQVNVIDDHEHKRLYPQLDLSASECPDFPMLLDKIREYHAHQRQAQNLDGQASSSLRVRVLVDGGLMTIQNDMQWIVALVTVAEIEWMDNQMKVIVDRIGGKP
ncbi:hypothetical protein FQN57_006107 [Myotisia sp. PD_48]|nr:hypothetical protein FQN57_006107 [Myotisia sp. PD_48]